MDSQRKNLAVLVEGYLHVDRSGSTEAVLERSGRKNGSMAGSALEWKRYYCVLERRVMCFYSQSPWISASPIKIEFRLPVTLTSLCRITAKKAGSYYANKFHFELSSPLSGTYSFYAPSKEKGQAWLKKMTVEISRIREENARLTFPFRGWVRLAVQPNNGHFSANQRVSALPLMEGFAVLRDKKVMIYGLPPSHYTETQLTPRRIIELNERLSVKKYAATTSNDYVFALKGGVENYLFCMASEVGRQLWMHACDLAILSLKYPELTLEQVKLAQFLQSIELEAYTERLVEAGFGDLDALLKCPASQMNKLVQKAGFTSRDEMRFKEELRFLRPVSVPKKKLKRQPSGSIDPTQRVETKKDKDVPSVKLKLLSREFVGKYPLSLKLGDAKQKKKTLLYAWGERRLLGLGNTRGKMDEICEPTQVTQMRSRNAPDAVFAGDGFTACVTKGGRLFTWGVGPLGVGQKVIEERPSPYPVIGLPKGKVTFASCGATHMTCVTRFGDLYAWGKGEYGQLGLGEACLETAVPMLVSNVGSLYNDEVVYVSCAARHTLVLTNEGFVYAMGEAAQGKLGNGDSKNNKYVPDWLDTLADCVTAQIAAGDNFSCSVALDGRLYVWGRVTRKKIFPAPVEMEQFDTRIIRHVCCNSHMAAILVGSSQDASSSSVYTLGEMPTESLNYLLGHESKAPEPEPRLVQNLEGHNVVDISLGKTHFSALCEDGRLLLWGNGDRGQLGIGTVATVATPHEAYYVAGYSYKWVVCGNGVTCAILEVSGDEDDDGEGAGKVIVPNNPAPIRVLSRDSIDPKKLLEEAGILDLVGFGLGARGSRRERDDS